MQERLSSDTHSLEGSTMLTIKSFSVKGIRTLTLLDMANEQLGQIMHQKFIYQHRKQFSMILFELQITDDYKKWKIIKRLNEALVLQCALKHKYKDQVPDVPIRRESDLQEEDVNKVLIFLEYFLAALGNNKEIQNEIIFLRFIENLVPQEIKKIKTFKQIRLTKQAGGRHNESMLTRTLNQLLKWADKFFTITSEGVYYTDTQQNFQIKEMIPFSVGFTLQYGQGDTGTTYGMLLNSSHRLLSIDAGNLTNMVFFVYFMKKAMQESDQLVAKRFQSFASPRQECKGKYYVDGKQYFSDLHEYLLRATRQVYITGWMLSPHFSLKRPDHKGQTRIGQVLYELAKKGIKIHIIIYAEPPVALRINSQFTETYLSALHKNIKILRHPAYKLIPFIWSHHEKMVIIDQKAAFMGGLDIGYGRMDDSRHLLNDQEDETWHGVDYVNYRVRDILNPVNYMESSIDRHQTPRMPWHDIAVRISGSSVIDLARHFVQYWNYVNFQFSMDQRQLLLYAGLQHQDIKKTFQNHNQQTWETKLQKRRSDILSSYDHSKSIVVDVGIDLSKRESFKKLQKHQSQQFHLDFSDKNHEEELNFYAHHLKKQETKSFKKDNLWNKFNPKQLFNKKQESNCPELIVTAHNTHSKTKGTQTHQILRSASMWGLGLEEGKQEHSILNAYCHLIEHAKEFIYIENQFFICVENPISMFIKERIERAHQNDQKFKIVVVVPALPGFDGEPDNPNATVLRIQVDLMYRTICRGEYSILKQLSYIKNLDQYIQFFSLRAHGKINEKPVTEVIYVHSKLMIVDDRVALIGSANINDRSLLGSRDSEIAVVIEDSEKIEVPLKGDQKRVVSKFAHNLRKQLYEEHFGLSAQEAVDYLDEDIWVSICNNAEKNSEIYKQIFGCYPHNEIKSYLDLKSLRQKADPQKYEVLSKLIKGNAVKFQTQFLLNEDLSIGPSYKEYYVPQISFT